MVTISIDEMEERDEKFWKRRAGERVFRKAKEFAEFKGRDLSKEEIKEKGKEMFKPEWWANIKKDGSLGRTTYSDNPRAIEQKRENQIGSAHWHSAREEANPSEGDKTAFIFRRVNPIESLSKKHQIECIHTDKETCCYDLREFDKKKVESDVASEMWEEGVDKEVIEKKCKTEGEIDLGGKWGDLNSIKEREREEKFDNEIS